MTNKKLVSLLLTIIWIVQFLVEALTFSMIWHLDMLPTVFLTVLAVLFVLIWLVPGILLLRKKKKGMVRRRIIALVLVVLVILGCALASGMVSQLNRTMNNVTGNTEITTVMTVYVLADDEAANIGDAADYTFAILQNIGADKTQQALTLLQKEVGKSVATAEYGFTTDMVDALYNGEVDALLLSSAYAGMLDDMDGYGDFASRTRVLHEISVVEQATKPKDPANSSGVQTTRPVVGSNNDNQNQEDQTWDDGTPSVVNTPFVVYLSGNDTRTTKLVVGRSDVNILAVVNPVTKQILLVNTPRDYFIPHPNSPNGERDKLTHLGNDGINCSIRGLENLYNERIDFYAQINFTGFETLIDAIGGVTVHFDSGFTTAQNVEIVAGNNYLDGAAALSVARERYSFGDGDNTRGKNQMKIIKAVVQKLASGAIIANYADIMNSLEGMFVTDFAMEDVSKLVKMQLSDMASWNIMSYAVAGDGGEDYTYTGGYAYVMYPYHSWVDHAADLMDRVIDGEILTEEIVKFPK